MKIVGYVVFVALVRYLFGDYFRVPFLGDSVSDTWIIPYLRIAGPDALFYFGAGAAVPWLFPKDRLVKSVLISLAGLLVAQLLAFFLFESHSASNWIGYLVLSAPFVGAALGFLAGVLASNWSKSARGSWTN